MKIEIISKCIGVGLILYAVLVADSVFAIAMTMLIGQGIALFLYGVCSQKFIGYKIKHQLWDLLLPILLLIPMAIYISIVSAFVENILLNLILSVAGGAVIYIAMSAICRVESFGYIVGILKSIRGTNTKEG